MRCRAGGMGTACSSNAVTGVATASEMEAPPSRLTGASGRTTKVESAATGPGVRDGITARSELPTGGAGGGASGRDGGGGLLKPGAGTGRNGGTGANGSVVSSADASTVASTPRYDDLSHAAAALHGLNTTNLSRNGMGKDAAEVTPIAPLPGVVQLHLVDSNRQHNSSRQPTLDPASNQHSAKGPGAVPAGAGSARSSQPQPQPPTSHAPTTQPHTNSTQSAVPRKTSPQTLILKAPLIAHISAQRTGGESPEMKRSDRPLIASNATASQPNQPASQPLPQANTPIREREAVRAALLDAASGLNISGPKFPCETCGERFSKAGLVSHMRMHSDIKRESYVQQLRSRLAAGVSELEDALPRTVLESIIEYCVYSPLSSNQSQTASPGSFGGSGTWPVQ